MKIILLLMRVFNAFLALVLCAAKVFFKILDFITELFVTTRLINKL